MINTKELVKKQDDILKELMKKLCTDKDSPWYGDFNPATRTPRNLFIVSGLPLYANEDSDFYKDKDLLFRLELGLDALLRYQLKSGLISLGDCNIDSPPDTAFTIIDMAIWHKFIVKVNMPELETLDKKILTFLEKTQNGMITGGFHTPNHRWVIGCALGFLYELFGNEKLKRRAQDYLDEGIDVNADGEWTERSNSIYNATSDLYMFFIGEIFGVKEAFEAVKKNLNMMKYLLHPNNYIATEYSTRQDRGAIVHMNADYTVVYQMMAGKFNDAEFAYMAELGISNSKNFGSLLLYSKVFEEYMLADIPVKKISDNYIKLINEGSVTKVPKEKSKFGDSILRYRKDDLSVTVMAGQQNFLFFQYKNARIFGMRLVVGWFGLGGVSFPTIEKLDEKTYRLFTEMSGKYWQTLKKEIAAQYGGNFDMMPNDEREDIGKVYFTAECIISLKDDGIEIEVSVDSEYKLFTQLVCMLDPDGKLECEDKTVIANNIIRQNSGKSVYTRNDSQIEVIGGGKDHDYDVIRGDVLNRDANNLVFNMMLAKKRKFVIKTV